MLMSFDACPMASISKGRLFLRRFISPSNCFCNTKTFFIHHECILEAFHFIINRSTVYLLLLGQLFLC